MQTFAFLPHVLVVGFCPKTKVLILLLSKSGSIFLKLIFIRYSTDI
ncbi:hypothetical protein FDUTEX481_01146 [Tolypothrix sp. PCC 7601]|nr:hypothetical protein FDUTEX481_01146 [Tolypothrix sp. PCC 7601]